MITGQQIITALSILGVSEVWLPLAQDANYVCPTKNWLNTIFRTKWKNALFSLGLTKYRKEVWDCEDIAETCRTIIKWDHALFYEGEPAGVAVGTFLHRPDGASVNHCIDVFITWEDPIEVTFWEPQIPEGGTEPVGIVELSQSEIRSCYAEIF